MILTYHDNKIFDQFLVDRACQAFHLSTILPTLARGAHLTLLVFGVSYLVSGMVYLVFGIWGDVSGIWYDQQQQNSSHVKLKGGRL